MDTIRRVPESLETRFEQVTANGLTNASEAPFGIDVYDQGLNRQRSARVFTPIYSLEFLEVHDTLAKYIDRSDIDKLDDTFIQEVLQYIVMFKKSDVRDFLCDFGFGEDVVHEVYQRLSYVEELNGDGDGLLDKLDLMSAELFEVFNLEGEDGLENNNFTQKDFWKAAFAIHKISERSSYSNEFNFIENVIKYLNRFFGVNFSSMDKERKAALIKVINEGAQTPVYNILRSYADPFFEHYNIGIMKDIEDPHKWFALYKEAVSFILKVFSRDGECEEETYDRIIYEYGTCGGLLPRSYSYFQDSITYDVLQDDSGCTVEFENFGKYIKKLIIENSNCESNEQWRTFSLAAFMLEVVGKINQLNSYRRAHLENANRGLIEKFLKASSSHVQFVKDREASNSTVTVVLSKIIVDGEVIPITYKFARIKSRQSMLRKTLVKGTSVSAFRDKFRMMVVVPRGYLEDEEMRRKICSAIINTHSTFLGNEIEEGSIKNTFESGGANQYSAGSLRCFKYATKFELAGFTDSVEIMILEEYPEDHGDYEENMYRKLREKSALCSYPRAMEQLAEEISRKALVGFGKNDIHVIRPLMNYVLSLDVTLYDSLDNGFKKNLLVAFTRAKDCKALGIYTQQAATCLGILSTMVGLVDHDEPEEEDMEHLSQ